MFDLKDKVCLVTGGARGIGRATALAFARAGANVAIDYHHSKEAAEQLDSEIDTLGVRCEHYHGDVANEEEANLMVAKIIDDFGRIDILVNNAGITRDKSFAKMTRGMWEEVLSVNLGGVFNVTHAVLPSMVELGWGRIINLASIVGQTGAFGQANYAVTKGGIIAFTMTVAREVARKGITVNAVAPGYIETDMTKDLPENVIEHIKSITPLHRMGKPEEVAAAVLFLASPEASYITGHVLSVNGGTYM